MLLLCVCVCVFCAAANSRLVHSVMMQFTSLAWVQFYVVFVKENWLYIVLTERTDDDADDGCYRKWSCAGVHPQFILIFWLQKSVRRTLQQPNVLIFLHTKGRTKKICIFVINMNSSETRSMILVSSSSLHLPLLRFGCVRQFYQKFKTWSERCLRALISIASIRNVFCFGRNANIHSFRYEWRLWQWVNKWSECQSNEFGYLNRIFASLDAKWLLMVFGFCCYWHYCGNGTNCLLIIIIAMVILCASQLS